jgi:hypothetical protein
VLTIWVIYYGAKNHPPGKWVVCAQDASAPLAPGVLRAGEVEPGVRPHETFFECDSLEEARAKVPAGLYRMDRNPADAPGIVETWF